MDENNSKGISINELAECLEGEILNLPEKSGEMVENLMVGAMCVDPAPLYFNVKSNKAVITRGDRADIQMGALNTPTKCLILTGGTRPIPSVMQMAEEKGVPILVVGKDTPTVLDDLEQSMGKPALEAKAPEVEPSEAGE
ncbi:MAG: DRTGG domain-containing protein [Dehalococcoidia bacterium]